MKIVLLVVDMQKYYLEEAAEFYRFYEQVLPGSMQYIKERCQNTVIPNIAMLQNVCREEGIPIVYLRLSGEDPERKDLHSFFREAWRDASKEGFYDLYPLKKDPMSEVVEALAPREVERQFFKGTFSGFTERELDAWLSAQGIEILLMSGLATSQCVETTARDGSERGYKIVQIEDAQADYDQKTHDASLFSSRGVCGGLIWTTAQVVKFLKKKF